MRSTNIKKFCHKNQCINLAGRAFTTYLDDVPAKMMWADGRVAEVYKEDKLYDELKQMTTPGVEYVSALIIKGNETFCFYGDGVQLANVSSEFERLKREQEAFLQEKSRKKFGVKEKIALPQIPKLHLPGKIGSPKVVDAEEENSEV